MGHRQTDSGHVIHEHVVGGIPRRYEQPNGDLAAPAGHDATTVHVERMDLGSRQWPAEVYLEPGEGGYTPTEARELAALLLAAADLAEQG